MAKHDSQFSPTNRRKHLKKLSKSPKGKDESKLNKMGSDLKMVDLPLYKTKEIQLFRTDMMQPNTMMFTKQNSNSSLYYRKKVLFKDRSQNNQNVDKESKELEKSKKKENSNQKSTIEIRDQRLSPSHLITQKLRSNSSQDMDKMTKSHGQTAQSFDTMRQSESILSTKKHKFMPALNLTLTSLNK